MKYLFISFVLLTGSSLLNPVIAQADTKSDTKSDNILKTISAEIKKLNSFYMEFDIKIKNEATGENTQEKGIGYVKESKYFASFGETVLISNGEKNWTVLKDENMTYQSNIDDSDETTFSPNKIMTIWDSGFKSKYVEKTTLKGKSVHEINLYPLKPAEVNYHTITVFVDVSTNDLFRIIMKTKDGGIITYTINKFEKNKSVNDSQFVYNPQKYPGYQLIRD